MNDRAAIEGAAKKASMVCSEILSGSLKHVCVRVWLISLPPPILLLLPLQPSPYLSLSAPPPVCSSEC